MIAARLLCACACATLFAVPVQAAGGGGHGGESLPDNHVRASFTLEPDVEDGGADGYGDAGELGPRAVIVPTLSMPSFEDGELRTYLFVDVRLVMKEGVDPWRIREQAHLIRDALIRVGHRSSIADPEHPNRIDAERAREILREGIREVVDLDKVERIEFTNVDTQAS